ncbi:phage tail tape measure protein [Pseudophaeobacter sp.]|uniref:phage tail tape measure protein n=1 Tax=Pseudophaeobacter sp. TaxID=1971739 RepID=UPI003265E10F
MSATARSYVVRLSAQGKREMERDLKALGVSGEKSLKLIQKASKPASKGLKETNDAAKGLKVGLKSISAELPALQRVARFMGTTALVGGIVAFGRSSLDVSKNFQAAMKRVQAATRASATEIEALSDKALQMGATTAFTASQSADAIEVLAKNGLSVSQILGGALDSTLMLAGALGGELAPSADLVTDLMQQFKLEASELPAIADALAGAALTSKFGFDDLRLAVGQSGGVAGAAGIEYSELLTALSGTASAFASGSDAGTSFKTFLQRLVPQSKAARAVMADLGLEFFDSTGQMKTMAEISEELQVGLAGLSDEARSGALQTLFGTDAIRTAVMLADLGGQGFSDLADGISKVSAEDQAEVRLQGLEGALKELSAAWEALQLEASLNGGIDVAEASVERFTGALRFLQDNFQEVEEIVSRVARALVVVLVGRGIRLAVAQGLAMRAAYVELAGAVSGVGTSASRALGPLARLGVAARAITGMMGGPLGLAVTAASMIALGADIDSAADALEGADRASDDAASALQAYAEASQQAGRDQETLSGKVSATTAQMVRQGRVAVQSALEANEAAQRALLDSANGQGLLNGDHIGRMAADVIQMAQAEWMIQGRNGPRPEFNVDTGEFENLGPVFDDLLASIKALKDGSQPFSEIAETLKGVAGAGSEVNAIVELMDDALNGAVEVDLDSVRDQMKGIAEQIGIFDDELKGIAAAESEQQLQAAYATLRKSMLDAAAAGQRLRETGDDGLLSLVTALGEGEKRGEDLRSALDGTWSAAEEKPEGTFVEQIGEQATEAANELERMDRAFGAISRRQDSDLNLSTDRGAYQRSEVEAAGRGILDLIGHVEGTDKGRGYNETLGYGAFTGGPVNLINMTLNEILELQRQMLAHPDNTYNSSAVGRYQIVSTTLKDQMEKLGLTGDELFGKDLQDRIGMNLVRGRMSQGREGFYNEWEGFRSAGTPWSTIQAGLGQQQIERVDPSIQKANEAAAENRLRIQKAQEQALQALIATGDEQLAQLELEASLVGKSTAEQERLMFIHEALTEAKRAGINVETQVLENGERLIDVIYRQADAIAARTEEDRKSLGLSDDREAGLQESKDAVSSAFSHLKNEGEGWTGVFDSLLDHMINKLWESAFDPVWDYLGELLDGLLSGGGGGGGGGGGWLTNIFDGIISNASGGPIVKGYAAGGDLQVGGRAAGLLPGSGHKRQDNILFWGSSKEFVQPGDSVDYYGVDFMEAIRQKRLPRHSDGGFLGGHSAAGPIAIPSPATSFPSLFSQPAPMDRPSLTRVELTVNVEGANGRADIEEAVNEGVSTAIDELNRSLPDRIQEINRDPKMRT